MYLPPFPVLGGLLAWATVYFIGFKRTQWGDFLLGLAAFLLAMVVQSPVQQLPLIGMGIQKNADIVARGTVFIVGTALWVGLVAGFVQEGVKYFLVKDKSTRTAFFVGLGFGITEVVFVTVAPIIAVASVGGTLNVPLIQALLSLIERYSAVLFHIGTTVFLAYAARKGFGRWGFLSMAVLHGFVDSLATYIQLLSIENDKLAMKFAPGFEALFGLIAIVLIAYTLPLARIEKPEEEKMIW
ncbi:hypothetical protein A3L09_04900 [Thermococcus profundus]|uniref:YhfC family intramembrane metalloprotease n=1 Tax=Thermococcus profundus TaxID=49899 RepID=A0A2Z2MFG5_THEPR|nr:YhfC family glutamic-type intramembrane protease [Thermococcus profundus]ASJ02644.1 hypothetical protein A3L09_04900 [Thermococcus profundus]